MPVLMDLLWALEEKDQNRDYRASTEQLGLSVLNSFATSTSITTVEVSAAQRQSFERDTKKARAF